MEIIFPNIEFVSHEIVQTKMYDTVDSIDSVSSSDLDIKHVYCFNNKGVEFTVEEYKMIGWLGERDLMHENDYIKHLGEYFTKEKICENSDKINREKIEVVNGDYELDFVYYVNSYEEIPQSINTFKEIYNVIYEYLPEYNDGKEVLSVSPRIKFGIYAPTDSSGGFSEHDNIIIYYYDDGGLDLLTVSSNKKFDWENIQKKAFENYKDYVNKGYITDPKLTPDTPKDSDYTSEEINQSQDTEYNFHK